MVEEQVISALWSHGTLLDLDVGRSTFQKRLKEDDVDLSGLNEDAYHLGHKKLLPREALAPLGNIESEARLFLKTKSLSFPLAGARFVYYKALKEVLEKLEACKAQYETEVANLIANYDTHKNNQLAVLDAEATKVMNKRLGSPPVFGPEDDLVTKAKTQQLWDIKTAELQEWLANQKASIRMLYPPKDDLPGMFRFTWRMFRINAVDGLSAISAMENEAILEAQEKLKIEMKKWVKDSASALHKSLGEAAANTKALLEKQGKLNPKNLKPLFEAFEVFKSVDFTGSSEFQAKIESIRQKFLIKNSDGTLDMQKTALVLNENTTSMQAFKEMLGTISDLAVDEVAEKAGLNSLAKVGEFSRLIEI